jgi:hypothetical protein
MALSISNSNIDVNSWYQKITLTILNNGKSAVDMNHAVIGFTASGHQDPWGVFGGTLNGNLPLTLSGKAQGTLDVNEIIINNSEALWLMPGQSGTLFFSFAATQVPVKISTFTLTLASSTQDKVEPDASADEPVVEPEPEIPADDTVVEPEIPVDDNVEGDSPLLSISALNPNSWYQRVTLMLTNRYSQSIDLNKLTLSFSATGHPDQYSSFGGSMLGNQPVTLSSDGGWPTEKNNIIINNDGELLLASGDSAELQFYLAATQTPISLSELTAVLAHDPARQGSIAVQFPAMSVNTALKPAFDLLYPDAHSQRFVGEWGQTLEINDLSTGNYAITVLELNNDEMKIAPLNSHYALTLASGHDNETCVIDYQSPILLASVCLNVEAPEFAGAEMVVELWNEAGICEQTLTMDVNQMQWVKQLLADHDYALSIQPTIINNQSITTTEFSEPFTPVAGELKEVNVPFRQAAVESEDFVNVQVTILGLPTGVAPQRYRLCNAQYQYVFTLESGTQPQTLPMRIAPGLYTLEAPDVFVGDAPWRCELDAPLRLLKSYNNVTLEFIQGVALQVKGWPNYLAHGGVTVNAAETVSRYRDVPVSALFKYDGFDGGGDPIPAAEVDTNGDGFLDYDSLPIHKTVPLVREIEKEAGRPVMPVMVVYTANASGGSAVSDLQNSQRLRNHFGNFITQCLAAQSYKDSDHAVPATFVLNPDFLGAMQQEPYGYTGVRQANSVDVNVQLAAAINALPELPGMSSPTLPVFSNDLYGYVQAINYIVRQFAPDVAFGWQTNVWATGTADWLLKADADPVAHGAAIASFIDELGVYSGDYAPDFIAFDKFERDCFSPDALAHYGWNATCWLHYLGMVKQAAKELHKPAMLWQIPGGHMPTTEEGSSKMAATHFASGGSFFMGDSHIGKDINVITSELLDMPVNSTTYGVSSVGDFLRRDSGYDWGQMQALNLPDYNVFAVLWGGGSTVSITTIHSNGEDGGWLAEKMCEYYAFPRYFSEC